MTDTNNLILLSISTNKLLNRTPTHNQITSESISYQCAAFVQLHDTRYIKWRPVATLNSLEGRVDAIVPTRQNDRNDRKMRKKHQESFEIFRLL